jgi:HEAT repeat protein
VVDLLIEALSDEDAYVRGSAASALGRIGDHKAITRLTELLTDEEPVVSMYGSSIAEVARQAITQIRETR